MGPERLLTTGATMLEGLKRRGRGTLPTGTIVFQGSMRRLPTGATGLGGRDAIKNRSNSIEGAREAANNRSSIIGWTREADNSKRNSIGGQEK